MNVPILRGAFCFSLSAVLLVTTENEQFAAAVSQTSAGNFSFPPEVC